MFRQILTLSGLILLLALLAGCGSDNKGTNPPPAPKPIRVVVADAATAPSLTSVDGSVWDAITPTQIDIVQSIFTAPRQSHVVTPLDSVKLQAARWHDSLWIRLQWQDNSHSVWRQYYKVTDTAHVYSTQDTGLWFSRQDLEYEDQAFILFTGLGTNLRDAWNWRALTTDVGHLAEGASLLKRGEGPDSLDFIIDAANTDLPVAHSNQTGPNIPTFVSKDTSEFSDYRLYLDPANLLSAFINTHGWTIGQRVPAYLIDTSIYSRDVATRGSRWDIRAVSDYDSLGQSYTVVMACPMNTGYDDDINFTAVDSVETQVGLYNNEILLQAGQYTKKFWLIF